MKTSCIKDIAPYFFKGDIVEIEEAFKERTVGNWDPDWISTVSIPNGLMFTSKIRFVPESLLRNIIKNDDLKDYFRKYDFLKNLKEYKK